MDISDHYTIVASIRTFTVSGFTLPVALVYNEGSTISAWVPGIATSKGGAQALVQRLLMQTVFDILESQRRSEVPPEAVISNILSQLNVAISYEPMSCQKVVLSLEETSESSTLNNQINIAIIITSNRSETVLRFVDCCGKPRTSDKTRTRISPLAGAIIALTALVLPLLFLQHSRIALPAISRRRDLKFLTVMEKEEKCIIIGNTVTGTCTELAATANPLCSGNAAMTANIIMANWSRAMWQSVFDRAARMLASGPFGSHFFSATATVGGN
ncbi:hypothetical protein KIN20_020636 [Parelaphostrongylus tenuis]|uniref:Uncharacterized protein n=1 Tax=Parelaphostrongylus tenuis TaxID=148309 RepID=A0AAD5N655_PARTN|nr:hypothetical protein KIN20_020636 [Parelaphostrongylus tenuis]